MRHLDLYPHNQKAYIELEKMLSENGRAAIIHPTGTGKSYIAFALAMAHPDKYFVWFASSEYIFNHQTDMLWNKQHIRLSNVEFHTYAWITFNKEVIESMSPDYIILDEFHRAGAKEWGNCIKSLVNLFSAAKLVGLSATNIRYLDHKRDMADEIFEGCVASEMGLCEAMAMGILPTPKYVIAAYPRAESLNEYEKTIESISNEVHKKRICKMLERLKHTLQFSLGMDEIIKKHIPVKNAKVIIFCRNSEHMMELIAREPEWFGKIDSSAHVYHVYSENMEAEEDFRKFADDTSNHLKLLYCIDMLNEGIHIDDIDAVFLCRPTISPIVYKQQIGRAIAAGSDTRPVIFDMVNNFENLNKIEGFREELQDAFKMYATSNGEINENTCFFEIVDELRECRTLLEEIQRNLDSTWETYYLAYKAYIKENRTAEIDMRHVTEDGLYLGKWVYRQRRNFLDGQMPAAKKELLDRIGMEWQPKKERRFKHWIKLLEQYKNENGDTLVSGKYITSQGEHLGCWCANVRVRYKMGKLSDERIRILENLGFQWEAYEFYWNEGYRHAEEYRKQRGNLHVGKEYHSKDGFRLGYWIRTQRAVRQGKVPGNLNDEKIAKLDELGMDWEGSIMPNQSKFINALVQYKSEYGHDVIPCLYVDRNGVKLGSWMTSVRMEYRKGKLSDQKKHILEQTGFKIHDFTYEWYSYYLKARAFYEEYGHAVMPSTYDEQVSQWIRSQRRAYFGTGPGKLSEEQRQLLEKIAIYEGSRLERDFEIGLAEFKKYVDKYHDGLVPNAYVTENGFKLGAWLTNKKSAYAEGVLKENHFKRLDESGMIWDNTEKVRAERYWNDMYLEAKKYAQEYGSISNLPTSYITEDGKKLGSWISQMRGIRRGTRKHNTIKMDAERIAKLDALGMNWEPYLSSCAQRNK